MMPSAMWDMFDKLINIAILIGPRKELNHEYGLS